MTDQGGFKKRKAQQPQPTHSSSPSPRNLTQSTVTNEQSQASSLATASQASQDNYLLNMMNSPVTSLVDMPMTLTESDVKTADKPQQVPTSAIPKQAEHLLQQPSSKSHKHHKAKSKKKKKHRHSKKRKEKSISAGATSYITKLESESIHKASVDFQAMHELQRREEDVKSDRSTTSSLQLDGQKRKKKKHDRHKRGSSKGKKTSEKPEQKTRTPQDSVSQGSKRKGDDGGKAEPKTKKETGGETKKEPPGGASSKKKGAKEKADDDSDEEAVSVTSVFSTKGG